ncbi:hypothetical protein Pfo_011239 [Paulownia fortunei]|nr:hypothetical protein Pfo_011239 [Paulownia fortunei]
MYLHFCHIPSYLTRLPNERLLILKLPFPLSLFPAAKSAFLPPRAAKILRLPLPIRRPQQGERKPYFQSYIKISYLIL